MRNFDNPGGLADSPRERTSPEEITAIERQVELCNQVDRLLVYAIPDTTTGEQELHWEHEGKHIYISTKENDDIGTTRKISIFYSAAYVINDKQELRRLQYSVSYTLDGADLNSPSTHRLKVATEHSTLLLGNTVIDETKPSARSEPLYDADVHHELMTIIRPLNAEDGCVPEL